MEMNWPSKATEAAEAFLASMARTKTWPGVVCAGSTKIIASTGGMLAASGRGSGSAAGGSTGSAMVSTGAATGGRGRRRGGGGALPVRGSGIGHCGESGPGAESLAGVGAGRRGLGAAGVTAGRGVVVVAQAGGAHESGDQDRQQQNRERRSGHACFLCPRRPDQHRCAVRSHNGRMFRPDCYARLRQRTGDEPEGVADGRSAGDTAPHH